MIEIIGAVSVLLVLLIAFLMFRAINLLGIANKKGESPVAEGNHVSALMFLGFLVLFISGFWWYFFHARSELLPVSASVHGEETDRLFHIALGVILIPFTVLNILLFYAAYRFRYRAGKYASFYPHNNKLEVVWTIVPGIVFTLLVLMGSQVWGRITDPAPEGAEVVNVMGYQFAWALRYPGSDGQLGKRDYRLIDASNEFGMDLSDASSYDDFTPLEMHLPKGRPVLLNIFSKDVIHSVFLPHFRLKMDAVPGMPTKFWFTPRYTTEEMRGMTGNPDFNYEMACTEVCGRGHFSMRLVVVVEEEADYEAWKTSQDTWLKLNPEYLDKIPDDLKEVARIRSGIEE